MLFYNKGMIYLYSFLNDYNEIAHPNILESVIKNNYIQTDGYGDDKFCDEARELIRKAFKCQNSKIHFFIGGTSTNLTTISHILKPHEAIVAADTAHINVHEAGAIEACGNKILAIKNKNGKLDLEKAQEVVDLHFSDFHMVYPKAVYISNATEMGTLYSLDELRKVKEFCEKNNLYLFVDGARLAQSLTSKYNDIKPEDYVKYTDLFYIGATKAGAMLGEALVINNSNLGEYFIRHMKQKGSVLAKGKLIGINFIELFKDNLFFSLGKHANKMAEKIYDSLLDVGYDFAEKTQSNLIFINLTKKDIDSLKDKYGFSIEKKIENDLYLTRFVTSWATEEEKVDELIKDMVNLKK